MFLSAVWYMGSGIALATSFISNALWASFIFLALSVIAYMVLCWYVTRPAVAISWKEHELRAFRHVTDGGEKMGGIGIPLSFVLLVVMIASRKPHTWALCALVTSLWIFLSAYLLEMWRLKNLGELLGWDHAPKK